MTQPSDQALFDGVLRRDRRSLAKAITLLESTRPDHRRRAELLLNRLLPHSGHALRIGISGVPGAGKSTFIEALGLALIDRGHRVAVLAVDPSSSVSRGSILGDKTRMLELSTSAAAYIRPSPAAGTIGGVAENTREAVLVCEAAGYDIVIIETVGVGQSEAAVAGMTDVFVLLQLPNGGDELQAIKRGVTELADLVIINKVDLDPEAAAKAAAQFANTPAMMVSAITGQGIDSFWAVVEEFHRQQCATGEFGARRGQQALTWMWEIVYRRLLTDFHEQPAIRAELPETLRGVAEGRLTPALAARSLLDLFEHSYTD